MKLIPYGEYIQKHGEQGIKRKLNEEPIASRTTDEVEEAYQMEKFKNTKNWYAVRVSIYHELLIRDFLLNKEHFSRGHSDKVMNDGSYKDKPFDPLRDPKDVMECYVPYRLEARKYKIAEKKGKVDNGSLEEKKQKYRTVWKERVLISGVIFVHTSLRKRQLLYREEIRDKIQYLYVDKFTHLPQPIPEAQMDLFQELVGKGVDMVICNEEEMKPGRRVMIVKGEFAGHKAELVYVKKSYSKTKFQLDKKGNPVLDREGNPKPCIEVTLQLKLLDGICAKFEILQSEVKFLDKK